MRSTISRLNCRGGASRLSGGYGADRADRSMASALTDAGEDGLWKMDIWGSVFRNDENMIVKTLSNLVFGSGIVDDADHVIPTASMPRR